MTAVIVQQAAPPVVVTVGIQGPRGANTAVGPGFKIVGAEIRFDIASLSGV